MTKNTTLEQKLQHVKQTLALAEKYDHAVNVLSYDQETIWRSSSGTQLAERPGIKQIAAEEPLEELQRHSTVRKPINQINCRQSALGIAPRALQRQNSLQTHPPDQNPFHIPSLASM